MKKYNVGILGATGMVGQKYIQLLENHPWFNVVYLSASIQSKDKKYEDAVSGRWHMNTPIPESVKDLVVQDINDTQKALENCDFVFSAFETQDKEETKKIEKMYAEIGLPLISNSSVHRKDTQVPMIIPEINSGHTSMVPVQQKNYGFSKGFIVTKPNCSIQSYLTPIYALEKAGFPVSKIMVTTLQAVSGAGYPGVASLDIIDNIIPYIGNEEEKTENEPLKILGSIENDLFVNKTDLQISATCTRVGVSDGHTATVSILFKDKKPTKEEIISIWQNFKSVPQEMELPSAPVHPIHYLENENRPQPKKDRETDKSMAVCVGRLRDCNVFDYKFVGLSHNTVRGASGGAILTAELLVKQGFIK